VATWTAVARDLAAVATGSPERVRDTAMLDDLRAVASRVPTASIVAFLDRLVEAARALEANASPELLVDVLVLAWPAAIPRPAPATAAGRTAGSS
jgi:hypothetical protein